MWYLICNYHSIHMTYNFLVHPVISTMPYPSSNSWYKSIHECMFLTAGIQYGSIVHSSKRRYLDAYKVFDLCEGRTVVYYKKRVSNHAGEYSLYKPNPYKWVNIYTYIFLLQSSIKCYIQVPLWEQWNRIIVSPKGISKDCAYIDKREFYLELNYVHIWNMSV